MKKELCGCCEGAQILTPQVTANRPGLPTLSYRAGVHATFLETMKARLSSADYPALAGLTTRDTSDPSIALLDAWATVADVLTFYQERIANEGYLGTAAERRSILELGRLVGYELRPGVAAGVFLAFELEKESKVEIPKGTRAQSLPGPGELPQPFETGEPLPARTTWNALKPRMTRPQNLTTSVQTIFLEGTGTNLKRNDPLLLLADPDACPESAAYVRKVLAVEPDREANRTKVTLQTAADRVIDETEPAEAATAGEVDENEVEERQDGISQSETHRIIGILKAYLDLEKFEVARTSMAKRVSIVLNETANQLEASDLSRSDVVDLLDKTLARLQEDLAAAKARGYNRLIHWLGGLVDELSAEREIAAADETPSEEATPAGPAETTRAAATGRAAATARAAATGRAAATARAAATGRAAATAPVSGAAETEEGSESLLTHLLKSPTPQPANALRLDRSSKTAFAEDSGIDLDIATALWPGLGRTYYQAWSKKRVLDPGRPRVRSVQVLRTKAAPFGHNAPLKPITDDEGCIVDYEEWSLNGMATTSIELQFQNVELMAAGRESVEAESHGSLIQPQAVSHAGGLPFVNLRVERGPRPSQRRVPLAGPKEHPLMQEIMVGNHPVAFSIGPALRVGRILKSDRELRISVDGQFLDLPLRDPNEWGIAFSRYTQSIAPGKHKVKLQLGEDHPTDVWEGSVAVETGKAHTLLLIGEQSDTQHIVYLTDDMAEPQGGKIRLRVIHLASNYPKPITASLIDKDTGERTTTLCTNLKYATSRSVSDFVEVEAGAGREVRISDLDGTQLFGGLDIGDLEGSSLDLYVLSLAPGDTNGSEVRPVPTQTEGETLTELAVNAEFTDPARTLRLYLQWQEVTDVTLTTKINDAQHDKTWVLRRREEVAETVDGATVILSFTDEHALASYRAGVSPTQDERETLVLDAVYDQITPGSCVVVSRPTRADPDTTEELILQVKEAQPISKAAYGITGRATQLVLDGPWLYEGDTDLSVVRGTTVYAQGEALDLSEAPISTPEEPVDVAGGEIELDGLYDGLEAGRWLSIAGERTDIRDEYGNVIPGIEAAEVVMLAAAVPTVDKQLIGDTPHTVLRLANDLAYTYKRDTVTIYGNVVKATHGETREEVLGSGDGSVPLQRFTLKQSPLTYLAAPTAAGVESTLEVRVNDVLWHEVARLVDQARNDRVYVTETDDDARTTVIFGDGDHGARLPTGVENVRALYRTGIGKVGNVDAQRITLLATRPLGVKGVINPRPASGGADRESRDQARRNVPIGVMTLDRLVSVQDYADFCRAFAGIGKARAARLTAGRRRLVHVTLAGADDTEIDPLSDLYRNLVRALGRYGDPYLRTRVEPRELMMLAISANVRLEPDYLWEAVAPEIRAKLLTTFGFEQRELGQDALLSEAISAIQSVPGVAYTDIDLFQAIAESDASNEARLEEKLDELTQGGAAERIVVRLARWQEREIRPAQLAYLTPAVPETLILTELTA